MIGMAKRALPDEVDEPIVLKLDLSQFPIMVFGIKAKESYPRLEKILQDEIADPLKRIAGVATVAMRVPLNRQINVNIDRDRLASQGMTPQDVARIIARENIDTPAGNIKAGNTDYLVRVPGEVNNVPELSSIVLKEQNGAIIRLSDVGTVEDGFEEVQRVIKINGESGAVLFVQKESEANTVKVSQAVHKRMAQLKKNLPPDIHITNVMDSSDDIRLMINDLSRTLFLGVTLTMLVVLLFLRKWKATIVVGLTIPFSIVLALISCFFLGYTINMITLFSLIIAVGMIVDNAIVVLENITRHRENKERPGEAGVYGAQEVGMAIAASTLTTVCIFFPLLFVKGITRILFADFAVLVSITLVASLFSALTLTPMLSATMMRSVKFGPGTPQTRLFAWSERKFNELAARYELLLKHALNHRFLVVILASVLFLASFALVPMIGTEFMPQEDKSIIRGTVYLPAGTRVERTAEVMEKLEDIVREVVPENERISMFMACGPNDSPMASDDGAHIGTFGMRLVTSDKRSRSSQEIANTIRKKLIEIQGPMNIEKFRIMSGDPMAGLLLSGEQPITVNIIGDDMEATDEVAARVKEIAENTPGAVDITVSREKGRPEAWVNVNREKASSMGLNVADVGDAVRVAFYGRTAGKYRVAGEEFDIFVRLREPDRSSFDDIRNLPLRLPGGKMLNTDGIADVQVKLGPVSIERKDQGRIVNVLGDAHGRSLGEVTADIKKAIEKMDVPEGVEVIMSGQSDDQKESFIWLGISLLVGLILVYMVMASQFESLLSPFIVMFSVPFAFTGSIWAIFLSGSTINVIILLGVLMLIGIVVNNAIVLVDYTNTLKARGLPVIKAVTEAGRARLRPVLMTALTTIAGLSPMAFGKGQSSEVWNPLGLTMLGGLTVSTFVTLIIVPVMYSLFETHVKKNNSKQG